MAGVDFTQKLNEDCLRQIYAYLDTATLRSLRTMSRQSSEVASKYLFRTVYIRPWRDRMEIVSQISQNAIFAGSVREIVWETADYVDSLIPLDRYRDAQEGDAESQSRSNAIEKGDDIHDIEFGVLDSSYDRRVDNNREVVWGSGAERSLENMAKLVAALRQFHRLRHVTVCSRARDVKTLEARWAPGDLTPDPQVDQPGRLPAFHDNSNNHQEEERQKAALTFFLRALGTAGRSLKSIHVQPVLDLLVAAVLFDRERGSPRGPPGPKRLLSMAALPKYLVPQLVQPLGRLRTLDLRLFHSSLGLTFNKFRQGCLGEILSAMPLLEEVAISRESICSFHNDDNEIIWIREWRSMPLDRLLPRGQVWQSLRVLKLGFLALITKELCNFFERHSATLEQITLKDILLDDTHQGWVPVDAVEPPYPFHEAGKATPSIPDYMKVPPGLGPEDERMQMPLQEWDQVVQACRIMPNLKGIRLMNVRQHSVGPLIGLCSTILEDRAMDGRTNCLRA